MLSRYGVWEVSDPARDEPSFTKKPSRIKTALFRIIVLYFVRMFALEVEPFRIQFRPPQSGINLSWYTLVPRASMGDQDLKAEFGRKIADRMGRVFSPTRLRPGPGHFSDYHESLAPRLPYQYNSFFDKFWLGRRQAAVRGGPQAIRTRDNRECIMQPRTLIRMRVRLPAVQELTA